MPNGRWVNYAVEELGFGFAIGHDVAPVLARTGQYCVCRWWIRRRQTTLADPTLYARSPKRIANVSWKS